MKNKLIIFTGPSGVGKATVEKLLFKDKELKVKLSCSATTRAPRENEVEGKHYFFLSKKEFDKKIKNNEFIEWNKHFSNKYGTLRKEIEKISKEGNNPFIEVETFGAKNIMEQFKKSEYVSIFLSPPSVNDLKKRIIERGTETLKQIKERMKKVKEEMSQICHFDYVVINDSIKSAYQKIKKIILGGNK